MVYDFRQHHRIDFTNRSIQTLICFQIGNIILIILYAFGLAGLTTVNPDQLDIPNSKYIIKIIEENGLFCCNYFNMVWYIHTPHWKSKIEDCGRVVDILLQNLQFFSVFLCPFLHCPFLIYRRCSDCSCINCISNSYSWIYNGHNTTKGYKSSKFYTDGDDMKRVKLFFSCSCGMRILFDFLFKW